MQRIGDRVRVTARLVRTSDGSSLWADRFEEKFTNIFAVEDAVAEKVARTTVLAMKGSTDVATERLTKRYTENNEAYEAYLKGRYMWNKRTADSLQKALAYFQQAIRLDPNYSLAYVGLADTYTLLSFFTLSAPDDAFPKAKAAAEKALAITIRPSSNINAHLSWTNTSCARISAWAGLCATTSLPGSTHRVQQSARDSG